MERIDPKKQQELLEIVSRHRERLLSLPGVHQVDVGYKYTDGKHTGEFAIRVHVHKKKSANELSPDELLPKVIEEVSVDVIETIPQPLIDRRWTESGKWHNVRYEPLIGGVSIKASGASSSGTLGAIVFDSSTLAPLGLTNQHVVGSDIGRDIFQPNHGSTDNIIGQILRTDITGDCALIELNEVRTLSHRIVDTPLGLTGITEPLVGMRVHKSGAATATTFGIIDGVSGNELTVIPDPERPITRYSLEGNIVVSGDSGSVWIESRTGLAVGLLWGVSGSPPSVRGHSKIMHKVAKSLNFVVEPANGGIAAVSRQPNNIDLFTRSRDGIFRHRMWNGSWQRWQTIDARLDSGPGAASWDENRIDVFYRGEDSQLHHTWRAGGEWQEGTVLGGRITSSPAAVSWGPNRIDVFARGGDGALHQKWWDGRWHGWNFLGGELSSAPAVSSWQEGRLDVFIRGKDNALWHKWWDGNWHDWESLGGLLTSGPTAVSWGPNRIDVFVLGGDRDLLHKWWDGNWQDWESLGGIWTSAPAACSWQEGRLDIFVRAEDQMVWHRWWDGNWHGSEPLGGFVEVDAFIAP